MTLFSRYLPFKESLEQYVLHCKKIFDEIDDKENSRMVEGFMKDFEDHRYNITIVGSFNRGKSTLLNTLMERTNDDISPIDWMACTSAIIKYQDRNCPNNRDGKEKAVVHHKDGHSEEIPLSRLREYVTEESNHSNRKGVKSVDVFGEFPEWSKAVTIIDSPGQNSVYGHHDILLSEFLPNTDAIIFLVASSHLDGGDIALLKRLSAEEKKKIFFVLTKIDELEKPDDLDVVDSFVKEEIKKAGFQCDKLYKVAARPVYEALCCGVTGVELDNLKEDRGILELEHDLEDFIVRESKSTHSVTLRIKRLVYETREGCRKFVNGSEALLDKREYDINALGDEKKDLGDKNDELRRTTREVLGKFERDWNKAVRSFERKFSSKAEAIERRINEGLGKSNLIGTVFQSFSLRRKVKEVVNDELKPLQDELEEKLSKVIETLNQEYDEGISLYARGGAGPDVLTGMSSLATASALAGTVGFGYNVAKGAVASAMGAISAWQQASTAMTTATSSTSLRALGGAKWMWQWVAGGEKAAAAVEATAAAHAATTTAITAGVTAVASVVGSIAATIIIQKILNYILVQVQEYRIPGIIEKVMKEMEASLFKGLDNFMQSVKKDYQQNVEDIIAGNNDRITEIIEIVSQYNPEERELIATRIKRVKEVLEEGVVLEQRLLLIDK